MGAQAVRLSNVDIDNALKNKDFEVLFQPIFDLGNGALARVESFVRWRHPTLGVLPPGAFISFFETQGRMSELTRYVLAESLAQYMSWRGPFAPGFSINLAFSDLTDEAFPSHLSRILRDARFPIELVTLECPMPAVGAEAQVSAQQFRRLADTGARLAIEVRGRANDFLRTISPFPFAEIKTGGAAILRFARTVRGPGLSAISELLELAAEQQAAISAVGVEDQASLAALRGLGFAAAQGNHLGKVGALSQFTPSRVNEVRELLGLEPLNREDLSALFRAGAPALPQAPEAVETASAGAEPATGASQIRDDDQLVERLAARIRRNEARAQAAEPRAEAPDLASEEERKAAAIARARRNTILRARKLAATRAAQKSADDDTIEPASAIAPHDMRERLTREFEAFAEGLDAPAPVSDDPVEDRIDLDADPEFAAPALREGPSLHESDSADIADAAQDDSGDEPAADAMIDSEDAAPENAPDDEARAEEPITRKTFGQRKLSFGARAYTVPVLHVHGADYAPARRGAALPDPALDIPVPPLPAETEIAPVETPAPQLAPAIDAQGTLAVDDEAAIREEAAAAIDEIYRAETAAEEPAAQKRAKAWWRGKYRLPRYSGYFWPRAIRRAIARPQGAVAQTSANGSSVN
jgi:EAL domain-containing protein (putative c-di-GMP-specific phosphodiesterase class I)